VSDEGKLVIICWHHGNIPDLAEALGAAKTAQNWKGVVFDRVWQINYEGGMATLKNLPQWLLPMDSDR
jgi:hypothetical protein